MFVTSKNLIMKIALCYKTEKISEGSISNIKEKILSYGFELDDSHPDVVLFIGGDGTFLRAVHQYFNQLHQVKFIGLCKGHLGFFYSYEEKEFDSLLSDLKRGACKSESHQLLKATVDNEEIYALNEIRIESPFHTLISDVLINDEFLETFRGNGLVVSTSLGSSAYNKSLGGAVIYPHIPCMELSEIAPINNTVYTSLHSSLVVDKDSEIVLKTKTENILVGYDHLNKNIRLASSISLKLSDKLVVLLRNSDYSYTKLLNSKFVGNK